MPDVVIVSDAASVREQVRAAITDPDATVRELESGKQLLAAVQESGERAWSSTPEWHWQQATVDAVAPMSYPVDAEND